MLPALHKLNSKFIHLPAISFEAKQYKNFVSNFCNSESRKQKKKVKAFIAFGLLYLNMIAANILSKSALLLFLTFIFSNFYCISAATTPFKFNLQQNRNQMLWNFALNKFLQVMSLVHSVVLLLCINNKRITNFCNDFPWLDPWLFLHLMHCVVLLLVVVLR